MFDPQSRSCRVVVGKFYKEIDHRFLDCPFCIKTGQVTCKNVSRDLNLMFSDTNLN